MKKIVTTLANALGRVRAAQATVAASAYALATSAHASSASSSGSGMPWENPLNQILTSIQGPVARFGILVAIIATGIMMAFGEHGSGFKKIMGIAFGGSMVLGVVSFVSTLFGASF